MNKKKKFPTQKKTWARLLKYLKRYIPLLIATVLLAGITVVLSLYIPILCGRIIDCIIDKGNVDFERIVDNIIKISVCTAVCGVLQWVMNYVNNRITYSVVRDVRRDAFATLIKLPLSYIDSHPHGETVSRVILDVDQFADGLLLGFTQLFTGIVTIVATLIFMLTISPSVTVIAVVLTPVSLVIAAFIAKKTYAMFRKQSETRGEMTALINDLIGEQKVVRAFSREEASLDQFDEINGRLEKYSLNAVFFSSITNPSTRFINNVIYAIVCMVGAILALSGSMTVGGLTSFLSYANQYAKPFNEISGVVTELQNAIACAERIFALIDEKTYAPDIENAEKLENVTGNVEVKNVDFSYTPERELIRNMNLSVSPGQRVAIVGPTGCGKTTIINLLMRFYDVDAGSIKVEGYDIRDVVRSSLHRSYGMVLQDTRMMNASVRDNIKMGRDATDDEVVEAAKAAHAHSFIRRLPNGYDTVISDDGGALSQGQRQLLCIARVMLKIPPMLILDEATSSIDTRTELKIQEAFARLMHGRTSFIVAHRLSTIREADTILVMKDGRIIEKGNHNELLKKGGFYSTLWNSQFEGVEQ